MVKTKIIQFVLTGLCFSSSALVSAGVVGSKNIENRPNDTLFAKQWYLKNTGQEIRRQKGINDFDFIKGTGEDLDWVSGKDPLFKNVPKERKILVAVLDTGIDLTHPDIQGRVWKRPNCSEEIKDKKTGKIEKFPYRCFGKNFLNNEITVQDDVGHGTFVAGLIAANQDNGIGIAGAAHSNVQIMPLKVLGSKIEGSFVYKRKLITDYFAEAIEYAVDNGAKVINISAGFPELIVTAKFRKAIDYAYSKSIPLIVAAGNNGKDMPVHPCGFSQTICVGAHDNQGNIPTFSNHGGKIDILAPGESIISLSSNKNSLVLGHLGYRRTKGTSYAAPLVAAVVANMLLVNPALTVDQIRGILIETATCPSLVSASESILNQFIFAQSGRVQMRKALERASSSTVGYHIAPLVKEIDQVVVDDYREFEIEIPLKNYGVDHQLPLEIRFFPGENLILEESVVVLPDMRAGEQGPLKVKGRLKSWNVDFREQLGISVRSFVYSRNYRVMLNFQRDLDSKVGPSDRKRPIKIKLSDKVKASDVLRLRGIKTSYFRPVFHVTGDKTEQTEFFYQNQKTLKAFLLELGPKSPVKIPLEKPKLNVEYIIRGDFNLDTHLDYLVVSSRRNKNRIEYFYQYLRMQGNKLVKLFPQMGEQMWSPQLSRVRFEGSQPITFGMGRPNFSLMHYNSPSFGPMIVPVVRGLSVLMDKDNGEDILDFQLENRAQPRVFAVLPGESRLKRESRSKKVKKNGDRNTITLKLLTTPKFENQIREQVPEIHPGDTVTYDSILYTASPGKMRFLVSFGQERVRNRLVVDLVGETGAAYVWPYDVKISRDVNTSDTLSVPVIEVDKVHSPGVDKITAILDMNFNYTKGQVHYVSELGEFESRKIETDFSDPFSNDLALLKNEGESMAIFESRFHIHFFNLNSESSDFKIPIYRESSFPGMKFSEGFEFLIIPKEGSVISTESGSLSEDKKQIGIFVNSDLLVGDQVYVVTLQDGKILRPLKFSYKIPANCSYMRPVYNYQNQGHMLAFNCLEDKSVTIQLVPLEYD